MKTGIVVADIMMKNPVMESPDTSILDCCMLMAEKKVASVLAVDDKEHVVGIITGKDVARKVVAKELSAKNTALSEIMATELTTVEPGQDIFEAIVAMKNAKVRQVPVIDKDRIVGLLTQMQIFNIEPQLFDIMIDKAESTRNPIPEKTQEKEGVCQTCGKYTKEITESEGMLLCDDCL